MGVFLAEGYLPSATAESLAGAGARAAEGAVYGYPVSYLGAVFLPSDQSCLLLFEAASAADVAEACWRVGLPCERVTPAVIARRPSQHRPSKRAGRNRL